MTRWETVTAERRGYSRWVADETMEDFALRFTARHARRWSHARVANTAIGSISFLALEAIGGAITLKYGFDIAVIAIMVVGLVLFLTSFPICYYAARYGVDIDLLTRGAGFGYLGSTITSLIYASFTFIFFALEAAILAFALEFCFGIPLGVGYLLSSIAVIPLVIHGFSRISRFQGMTQSLWVLLHILPFAALAFSDFNFASWTSHPPSADVEGMGRLLMFGAASGVIFALIAQVGEQVDFIRFMPEPKTPRERRHWWLSLLAAGPGWSVLGVIKMLAGSCLITLALSAGVAPEDATDPTQMYFVAFEQFSPPVIALLLTGVFVVLSQMKINVTNAYAGSIAWSNFFSRLTHAHPGRVVWLVFNVGIALLLMELGAFSALEHILGLYAHVALAWIGALTADLVVNKPLGLSPNGIEFRRAHLHDINPVGIGAMIIACVFSVFCVSGLLGPYLEALSAFVALITAFTSAPVIAWVTKGRYYIARPVPALTSTRRNCVVCDYEFDSEDMTHCPFHAGPICSLCCTLDRSCSDRCKTEPSFGQTVTGQLATILPEPFATLIVSRIVRVLSISAFLASIFGLVLMLIYSRADQAGFDALLTVLFCVMLIVIGVSVWVVVLSNESQHKAMRDAETQTNLLRQEVRAHERTDRELQKAKEKAEAANDAKTKYMTGLSHELRTPLNAIYGYAQILEKAPDLPSRRRDAVGTIRRSSEHLAGLIEGLLDISRIESGRLEIARDRVNLRMFLQQIGAIFREQAREKGIDFEIVTTGTLPGWVTTDEKRLRQILINLLSNAFRYTEHGHVKLKIRYRSEVAIIEVEDTGSGISEEDQQRIWRPFERGNSRVAGVGLGLTITQLLVDILGGDISLESEPGVGSTFRARLMLPSLPQSSLSDQAIHETATSLEVSRYRGPRKVVMVVDDDADHLNLTEDFLSSVGFSVLAVPDAAQALSLIEEVSPDLFVVDIDMPGMDGWSLARKLRASNHRSTPIIIVSGHAADDTRLSPNVSLCDAFIAKPFSLDDLLLRISELLRLELVLSDAPTGAISQTSEGQIVPLKNAKGAS